MQWHTHKSTYYHGTQHASSSNPCVGAKLPWSSNDGSYTGFGPDKGRFGNTTEAVGAPNDVTRGKSIGVSYIIKAL